MAGFGEYSGYNRPFSFDRPINNEQDFYDIRYQQMYGYQTPLHEEYQGPPLVIDESPDDESSTFVTTGISVASLLTENLLSHPFIVLRRQCQVHNTMKNYHIVPYTLLPVIVKLHRRQEITTLWKGIGSTCVVRGVTLAFEDIISKFTPWPKDINKCKSALQFFQHILLKCVSFAIITPFYSASFVETVQSDIASDKPGLFDVFKEGGVRLLEWGSPRKGRMLPIWAIVIPTVGFGVSKYLFQIIMRGVTRRILRFQQRHRYEINDTFPRAGHNPIIEDIEMKASLFAFVSTEVAFYPVETIIHRLHIQGTRTIIDNLDTGTSVQPILTGYEGFFDCYNTTLAKEGPGGFYKGFGALVFQLCAHFAIIKLSTWIVSEISYLLRPASKPVSKSHSEVSLYSQQKYLLN